MCLNLLLRSLNVADGLRVTQTGYKRYTSLRFVSISKSNMHLYMHSYLVLMFIMFPIIKLRNYMVAGQNQPQTLNYDKCRKDDLHVYYVFYSTVTG